MQISRINFYSINNNKERNVADSFRTIFPQYDTVSFSATGKDGKKMRKMFHGIHCPCCGIKMLSGKKVRELSIALANMPVEKAIKKLQSHTFEMHFIQRSIFFLLKRLHKEHPEYTIRELLDIERPGSLEKLCQTENQILDRISQVILHCPPETKRKINEILKEAENLLSGNNINSVFKRHEFIEKIKMAIHGMEKTDLGKNIKSIAKQLPGASTDKNAFIVKYTQKNPLTGCERTSEEIFYALLAPSIVTIEHVKARSRKASNGGGANLLKNYLAECSRDNFLRGDDLFRDFVKQNPQFFGNHLQKYIDEVIKKINEGNLKGFEKYPILIARTLRRQSKNILNPDISKLDPKYYKAKELGKSSSIE